jgi:predicted DNA-binding protein with PD1-like motif
MIPHKGKLLLAVGFQLALYSAAIKAQDVPAVHLIPSPVNRVVVVRLKNKTDILEGLKQAIEREKIKNAVIISGFGSVGAYNIHVVSNMDSPYKNTFAKASGPFDVLTVSGMVIDGKIHAHITLSNLRKTTGGHLSLASVLAIRQHHAGVLSDCQPCGSTIQNGGVMLLLGVNGFVGSHGYTNRKNKGAHAMPNRRRFPGLLL